MIGGVDIMVEWLSAWDDLLLSTPTRAHFAWLGIRSLGTGGSIGAVLGALLALCLGWFKANRQRPAMIFGITAGLTAALAVLAHRSASLQLDQLGGLPLSAPDRLFAAAAAAGQALLAGGGVAGSAWLLARRFLSPIARIGRWAVACGLATLLLLVAGDLGLGAGRRTDPKPGDGTAVPSQVVVVGLDGLTFRVLTPLLRSRQAPAFQRLIDEGAWGTWTTYGTTSSPQVWTSMATGHRVRDHGIDDFVRPIAGRYRATPLKSSDRRTRAIWSLLGEAGSRVAIVDWLITFPPEPVAGYMVPRLNVRGPITTFPPELGVELGQELPPLRGSKDPGARPNRRRLIRQIDRAFDTAELLITKEKLDFLAVYSAAADAAEHTHWRDYQREAFAEELWPKAHPESRRAALIPEIYRHLDHRLGRLREHLEDNALLIVVSDHGQRAARRPRTRLRLDRLLAKLGYARLRTTPDGEQEIDVRKSRAYTLVETPWTPSLRVNLNQRGREPKGRVQPAEAPALLRQLATELESLRFANGEAVFGQITIRNPADAEDPGADLLIQLSPALHDPACRFRTLVLGKRQVPMRRFFEIDFSISGAHDHQGVLLAHGPGVRPGPVGQRMIPTDFHRLLWHLTDKVDAVDRFLPLLRRLGILDRATTLDLTPSVLHALGLPVARDMEGRPLTEILAGAGHVRWIDSYEVAGTGAPPTDEDETDEQVLERLRTLGYVK